MTLIVADVVFSVTGIDSITLSSKRCSQDIIRARAMFVELCTGVVSPTTIISNFLCKNNTMVSYYKKAFLEYYDKSESFRTEYDNAEKLLTDLLTTANESFRNVFQKEK